MARKMTEWPSKRGSITKITPSDGCKGVTVPLVVGRWYDFHEFGYYLGNVGLDVGRLRISEAPRSSARMLPRLAARLYGTVMSNARLKSLVARAPKRILSMTEPWVKVPSVQENKAMAKPPFLGTTEQQVTSSSWLTAFQPTFP